MKTLKDNFISMKINFLIMAIIFAAVSNPTYAQKSTVDKATIGIGLGLDYGGIGGNFLYYPQNNIGLFAGLGYNLVGVGYNVGAKIRLINAAKPNKISPYVLGMYGYNTVIVVKNASQFDKVFYGTTFGLGLDYKSSKLSDHYWTFALLLPTRGSEVDDYFTSLKNNHSIVFNNNLSPVTLSIGYRILVD
jgi:hypothetical protein